jgi:hypothetical protein
MSKIFFNIFLWIVGIVASSEEINVIQEKVQARGKCRQIIVENNTVKIKFLSKEDADIFANDLEILINGKN